MSTDDIFDDDLDEFDTDSEVDQFDTDDEEQDLAAVEPDEVSPADAPPAMVGPAPIEEPPGKKPFFRNWVWWTSLIAAIPGAALLSSIVLGMKDYGGEFNWMMWVTAGGTFFGSAAATVLPLLIALGFFMGGEVTTIEEPKAAPPAGEDSFADSDSEIMEDSDDDVFDDEDDDDSGFGEGFDDDDDDDEGTAFEFE